MSSPHSFRKLLNRSSAGNTIVALFSKDLPPRSSGTGTAARPQGASNLKSGSRAVPASSPRTGPLHGAAASYAMHSSAAADDAEAGEDVGLLSPRAGHALSAQQQQQQHDGGGGGAGAATDGGQAKADRRWWALRPPNAKVALGVALLLLSLLCLHYFSAEKLYALFAALQGDPLTSAAVFFVFNALGVVLMLPGMVLSIGAGAVFGFARGAALSWAATVLGTTLSFMLGRYLLADVVAGYVAERFPSYSAIEAALAKEGWKLVLLLKVAPFSPWNVLNYVLSATPVSLASFALPSAVAAVPYVCLFSYMGSVSNNLLAALHGSREAHISITWLVLSPLLLLFSAVGVVVLTRRIMHSSAQAALVASELELPMTVATALTTGLFSDAPGTAASEPAASPAAMAGQAQDDGALPWGGSGGGGGGQALLSGSRRARMSAPG